MVGIVGIGQVGTNLGLVFPEAIKYDKYKNIGNKETINLCDIVFVCVPTPMNENGSCDTSEVEETLQWIDASVIAILSTIPVGFVDMQKEKLHKHIIFIPEYFGETANHPFANPYNKKWITLGGDIDDCKKVANLYKKKFNSELIINYTDARTAELAKLMGNSFFAMKVSFCNQFYDLAQELNVDYDKLRETWLLDPRINRDHTFVYEDNRGFRGKCLPKDLASIIYQGQQNNTNVELLQAIQKYNNNKTKKELN